MINKLSIKRNIKTKLLIKGNRKKYKRSVKRDTKTKLLVKGEPKTNSNTKSKNQGS